MRNTDNIPKDLISRFWCAECNDECSTMDNDYQTYKVGKYDIPLCMECKFWYDEEKGKDPEFIPECFDEYKNQPHTKEAK